LLSITRAIASAAAHLHQRGITHGDLYGHNILINDDSECILGDFGAASLYQHMDTQLSDAIEKIEVCAFGCLLEELLLRLTKADISKHTSTIKQLKQLEQVCLNKTTNQRPAFSKIHAIISGLNS
ncbi:MAG: protein kinase, partial [Ghiorsea sp.]|nr:protein kinase [Ghiorsea sp.]